MRYSARFRWYGTRMVQLARSAVLMLWYTLRNRQSSETLLGTGPIVTLTSYGKRIDTVHLTIESIGYGRCRPRRLILFLDDQKILANLPASLSRLVARGLEVLPSANLGPHTKYYPFVAAERDFSAPLVTADDDMLYPTSWLAELNSAHLKDTTVIWCQRARLISFQSEKENSFREWPFAHFSEPSSLIFFEGVSGVIYPPAFLRSLKALGDRFLACCPKHDDAWLNAAAFKFGFKKAQLSPQARSYSEILGTIALGLWQQNQGVSGEVQLERAFAELGVSPLLKDPGEANSLGGARQT